MEHIYDLGLAKAIGLSNFNIKQIERVLDNCKIRPANLQVFTFKNICVKKEKELKSIFIVLQEIFFKL